MKSVLHLRFGAQVIEFYPRAKSRKGFLTFQGTRWKSVKQKSSRKPYTVTRHCGCGFCTKIVGVVESEICVSLRVLSSFVKYLFIGGLI